MNRKERIAQLEEKLKRPDIEPLVRDDILEEVTRLMNEENEQSVINPESGEPLTTDAELLKRACELLDGMLHDASGTITYSGGPNAGRTLPTQEAECLASEFRKVRDVSVRLATETERARIVAMLRHEVAKDDTSKKDKTFTGAIVEGVMAVAKGTLLGFADRIEAGIK